jgi:hypothetical protein
MCLYPLFRRYPSTYSKCSQCFFCLAGAVPYVTTYELKGLIHGGIIKSFFALNVRLVIAENSYRTVFTKVFS